MTRILLSLTALLPMLAILPSRAAEAVPVEVTNIRRVFHNGEHNAFTDLIRWRDRLWLTFRSCPGGHAVFSTSRIIVLASDDEGKSWDTVHEFSVPDRDTRDPHFLAFRGKLFVYTGTWYAGPGEEQLPREQYDLNKHLGYAVFSEDGTSWSEPHALEGTYGHYIWRAASHDGRAYLCGRRKKDHSENESGAGAPRIVQSALLESDDGLVWRYRSLFQENRGDETAFHFFPDGRLLGLSRSGSAPAHLVRSRPPYETWDRRELSEYVGGPLLAKWGDRFLAGGRRSTGDGPVTQLYWLIDDTLVPCAQLPSGGDNSYPGFVSFDDQRGLVSWYSSHERDESGEVITAIYLADLAVSE